MSITTPTVVKPVVEPVVVVVPRAKSRWWAVLPLMAAVAALAVLAVQAPPDGKQNGTDLFRFLGRLHPMLTHAPIALLFLMPVFDLLGVFRRARHLWASGQLVMWLATLGAIVAAAAGYAFARFDGYGGEDLIDHQWAGIATAGACTFALMFRSLARGGVHRKIWALLYLLTLGFTLVCVSAAGHLGGKLQYGDTFYTEYAPEPIRPWVEWIDGSREKSADQLDKAADRAEEKIKSLPEVKVPEVLPTTVPSEAPAPLPTTTPTDVQTSPAVEPAVPAIPLTQVTPAPIPVAVVDPNRPIYASIVEPIFLRSCVECHGPKKVKGGLHLDTYDNVIAGGNSQSTVVPGNLKESELAITIRLPRDHDDVMPPKDKPPLSEAEIAAIEWWIEHGASGTLTIGQAVELPAAIKAIAVP